MTGEHRLRLVVDDDSTTAKWTCTYPDEGWCHQQCAEQCDAWAEGQKCEHPFVSSGECGILPWLENATWDETHTGETVLFDGPVGVEAGPDYIQWSTDGDDAMPTFLVDNDGVNPPTITEIPAARSMTAYTNDDVTAAAEAMGAYAMGTHGDDLSDEDAVRAVLAAVAPAIAARTLRQAADDLEREEAHVHVVCARELRARAEQVAS